MEDKTTQSRVVEHLGEGLQMFPYDRVVGIFLQGSQNYGLEVEGSDVDTKMIVLPAFKDIACNKKPVSTTYVRENNEHIDLKDLRLMFATFRKQNLNFIEILFTPYKWLNPLYKDEWMRLINNRERIAHYNPYSAVKTMKGIAMEKWHAMEHEYPSKIEILRRYGYDPKQLHHLLRIEEYLQRYITGENYEDCLRPRDPEYLKSVKLGLYDLDKAREVGAAAIKHVTDTADTFCKDIPSAPNLAVDELLDDVQYNIMRTATRRELE